MQAGIQGVVIVAMGSWWSLDGDLGVKPLKNIGLFTPGQQINSLK